MRLKMELLSDTIFGNGVSVPGAEDSTVLQDECGFPYYKGGTFKGVFREELCRYLNWTNNGDMEKVNAEVIRLLGKGEAEAVTGDELIRAEKLVFSDFILSAGVRQTVLNAIGEKHPEQVLNAFTHLRTFTAISEEGTVKEGSLRSIRCVNKGLIFYSDIVCCEEDKELVRQVVGLIKFIGSKKNRGFGKVKISVVG